MIKHIRDLISLPFLAIGAVLIVIAMYIMSDSAKLAVYTELKKIDEESV